MMVFRQSTPEQRPPTGGLVTGFSVLEKKINRMKASADHNKNLKQIKGWSG